MKQTSILATLLIVSQINIACTPMSSASIGKISSSVSSFKVSSTSQVFSAGQPAPSGGVWAFGSSAIHLQSSYNDGAAVTSMVFNGKEFIRHNKGEDMQVAYLNNGAGECNNPTQGGSATDPLDGVGSTYIVSVGASDSELTSVTNPAYFEPPGYRSSNCALAPGVNANTTINDTTQPLTTHIVAGIDGDPQVLSFTATIENTVAIPQGFVVSIGAALQPEFSNLTLYRPYSNTFVSATSAMPRSGDGGWTAQMYLPTIMSTADGQYAIGVIAADQNGMLATNGVNCYGTIDCGTNSTFAAKSLAAGTFTWTSYYIVGTLADVKARMPALYLRLNSFTNSTVFDGDLYRVVTQTTGASDFDTGTDLSFVGEPNGVRASAIYDYTYYAAAHPLAQGQAPAYLHNYMKNDLDNGVRASLEFDPVFYLNQYPQLAAMFGSDYRAAANHWQTIGIDKGLAGSADFNVQAYLINNPDLQQAFGANGYRQALYHWITTGRAEGRIGTVQGATSSVTLASAVIAPSVAQSTPDNSQAAQAVQDAQAQAAAQQAAQQAADQAAAAIQAAAQHSAAAAQAASAQAFAARQTQTVYRFVGAQSAHIFVLTADGASLPAGFTIEGAVFETYLAQYANTIPLQRCSTGTHQFLSADPGCEGQQVRGQVGFISTVQANGLVPLYRMSNAQGDYFESTDTTEGTSAGYNVEGSLGFVPNN